MRNLGGWRSIARLALVALLPVFVGCQSVEAPPEGPQWGTPKLMENRPADAIRPQIAIDAMGNAIAVWLERGSSQWSVHTARYTSTEGWGPSERIDQATYVIQTPDLAVSASGKAAAVWGQRSDGRSGQRIWANQYE